MVREPPPRRNDAALLSKIASQEKLRAELRLLSLSLSPPPHPLSFERTPPLPCPGTPSPRATAWFLLQESIRWLQESGGFYVKILQKIMARYIYFPPRFVRSSRFIPPSPPSLFLTSSSVFRPDIVPLLSAISLPLILLTRPCLRVFSTELPCTESASL